jgi:hypothetical protein
MTFFFCLLAIFFLLLFWNINHYMKIIQYENIEKNEKLHFFF